MQLSHLFKIIPNLIQVYIIKCWTKCMQINFSKIRNGFTKWIWVTSQDSFCLIFVFETGNKHLSQRLDAMLPTMRFTHNPRFKKLYIVFLSYWDIAVISWTLEESTSARYYRITMIRLNYNGLNINYKKISLNYFVDF